ncbi:MAG TPA: dTMP kinase [Candidatus Saccharimonadales bacterium]|nr:dTMP kinase [Candidatus Saccharimonadales bacterium]
MAGRRLPRGAFITLEGVEGSGKTTQGRKLLRRLRRLGLPVLWTREPGGVPISERVRRVLLDRRHREMGANTEMLLYLASRAQNVEQLIKPALHQGQVVLCDRFADATFAYQGGGRGLPRSAVAAFNRFATGGLKPDLTLFFDLSPEEGFRRLGRRPRRRLDRLEVERAAFYRRVRQAYLELVEREPRRVKRIPGAGTPEQVHERVLEVLEPFLRRRRFLRPQAARPS